jgi:hypothetical protein
MSVGGSTAALLCLLLGLCKAATVVFVRINCRGGRGRLLTTALRITIDVVAGSFGVTSLWRGLARRLRWRVLLIGIRTVAGYRSFRFRSTCVCVCGGSNRRSKWGLRWRRRCWQGITALRLAAFIRQSAAALVVSPPTVIVAVVAPVSVVILSALLSLPLF